MQDQRVHTDLHVTGGYMAMYSAGDCLLITPLILLYTHTHTYTYIQACARVHILMYVHTNTYMHTLVQHTHVHPTNQSAYPEQTETD